MATARSVINSHSLALPLCISCDPNSSVFLLLHRPEKACWCTSSGCSGFFFLPQQHARAASFLFIRRTADLIPLSVCLCHMLTFVCVLLFLFSCDLFLICSTAFGTFLMVFFLFGFSCLLSLACTSFLFVWFVAHCLAQFFLRCFLSFLSIFKFFLRCLFSLYYFSLLFLIYNFLMTFNIKIYYLKKKGQLNKLMCSRTCNINITIIMFVCTALQLLVTVCNIS